MGLLGANIWQWDSEDRPRQVWAGRQRLTTYLEWSGYYRLQGYYSVSHSSPSQHSSSATAATLTLPEESFGLSGGKQRNQQLNWFMKSTVKKIF